MAIDKMNRYGAVIGGLVTGERSLGLSFGNPNRGVNAALKGVTLERAFAGQKVVDEGMARCAIAGLWLYHDFMEESHGISQEIETATGSYWHGILHRREPDYENARYWFRRVGRHPVFAELDGDAGRIGAGAKWDPFVFIDACERARREGGELETICREVQMKEWWALFNFCFDKAIGR